MLSCTTNYGCSHSGLVRGARVLGKTLQFGADHKPDVEAVHENLVFKHVARGGGVTDLIRAKLSIARTGPLT